MTVIFFMIISPDGSIRLNEDENSTVAGIKFKCPLNDIHAKMHTRYLDRLLYLCWRQDFSSLFKVKKEHCSL